jgi:hypothetical protein
MRKHKKHILVGGMPEYHRLPKVVSTLDKFISDPDQVVRNLRVLVPKRIDPGMGKEVRIRNDCVLSLTQELEMVPRYSKSRLLRVVGRSYSVTLEALNSPIIEIEIAPRSAKSQKRKQHIVMVSTQEYGCRVLLLKLYEQLNGITRRGAAINIITDKNYKVGSPEFRSANQVIEQRLQLSWTAMNIANSEDAA